MKQAIVFTGFDDWAGQIRETAGWDVYYDKWWEKLSPDDPPGIWQIVRGVRMELSRRIEADEWESGQMG